MATICSENQVKKFLSASRQISDERLASGMSSRNCSDFVPLITQEWAKRAKVLEVCSQIATSPTSDREKISTLWESARDHIELAHTTISPRVDSYGARDELLVAPDINSWIRREQMIEGIVRDTTISYFQRRCGIDFDASVHSE